MQLKALTSIRFIFALLVVLFHGLADRKGCLQEWPPFLASVINHGFVGVDFFFVLSGFILAYSYSGRIRGPGDETSFWLARAARILPAYYLAFFVFLPFAVIPILAAPQPGNMISSALAVASLQLALLQAWVPGAALAWNSPAWSLSVEACFYALFPFLLPRIEKLSMRMLAITAGLAYLAAQGLALGIWQLGPERAAHFLTDIWRLEPLNPAANSLFYMYFPLLRIPEFLFGIAIGTIFVRVPSITARWRRVAIILGATGLIAGFSFLEADVPPSLISNGLLMPFLGLILFGLARSPSRFWTNHVFVELGDASYSLYLLHVPVFLWVMTIDRKLFHLQDRNFSIFFIGYLLIVIAASILSLNYIERPCRYFIRRRFSTAHRSPLETEAIVAPLRARNG